MSKKHFIALADALRAEKPEPHWCANKHAQWNQDVQAIARACRAANPSFDEDRWIAYINGKCGPSGGKRQ